jgi:hypothetical protein
MLAEKELQGRQHRPRATFGASTASRTHTPASSHTPSTPAAHVGNLPLQVPAKKQHLQHLPVVVLRVLFATAVMGLVT